MRERKPTIIFDPDMDMRVSRSLAKSKPKALAEKRSANQVEDVDEDVVDLDDDEEEEKEKVVSKRRTNAGRKRKMLSLDGSFKGTTKFNHCLIVYAEWNVVTIGTLQRS